MGRLIPSLVVLLALAACSSAPPATSGTTPTAAASSVSTVGATPTVAPAPAGTTLMHDGTMKPGTTYVTAGFDIRFSVSVPASAAAGEWLSASTRDPRQLHIGEPAAEGAGMTFYLPTGGYDDASQPTPVPADFVAWMTANPQLTVVSSKKTSLGGLPATRLVVKANAAKVTSPSGLCPVNSHCVLIASTAPDLPLRPMFLFPQDDQEVYVVNVASGQLLVELDAGSTQKPAEALLRTLRFVGS